MIFTLKNTTKNEYFMVDAFYHESAVSTVEKIAPAIKFKVQDTHEIEK